MRRPLFSPTALVCLLLLACGDSTGPTGPAVHEIQLVAPGQRLLVAEEVQLTPLLLDVSGEPIDDAEIEWKSSAPGTVSVSGSGKVRGVANGQATISASVGGVHASLLMEVVARPTSCAETGTVAAPVTDSTLWRTADGPHHLRTTVAVSDKLVIQSGALVCGDEGAAILLGPPGMAGASLSAVGAEGDTIVFTAADPARPWGGIKPEFGVERVDLAFVRLEHAEVGVGGIEVVSTEVRDAHFRQISGQAIGGRNASIVERVVLDTVGTGLNFVFGPVEVRFAVIRDASGTGILLQRGAAELHDVQVLSPGTIGIYFSQAGARLTAATNVLVADAGDIGVVVRSDGFTITNFVVTGSGGAGISIRDVPMEIHQSNIFGNAGPGVLNSMPATIDATGNWWGDPAGPDGPNGDGVQGPVDVMPVLQQPVGAGD